MLWSALSPTFMRKKYTINYLFLGGKETFAKAWLNPKFVLYSHKGHYIGRGSRYVSHYAVHFYREYGAILDWAW